MSAPDYAKLLADPQRSGVYWLPTQDEDALIRATEALGFMVFRVDLARARDKAGLLEHIGKAMVFPEWFGHNDDALADCLGDLGWRPALGYIVLLEHCAAIHAQAASDFAATLQIFREAAAEWRTCGTAFWCFSDAPDSTVPVLA